MESMNGSGIDFINDLYRKAATLPYISEMIIEFRSFRRTIQGVLNGCQRSSFHRTVMNPFLVS